MTARVRSSEAASQGIPRARWAGEGSFPGPLFGFGLVACSLEQAAMGKAFIGAAWDSCPRTLVQPAYLLPDCSPEAWPLAPSQPQVFWPCPPAHNRGSQPQDAVSSWMEREPSSFTNAAAENLWNGASPGWYQASAPRASWSWGGQLALE